MCVVCFLLVMAVRMVLINGCIDCARFAHANQLCPIPLTLPQETLLYQLFACWFLGEVGQWGTSTTEEQSQGGLLAP